MCLSVDGFTNYPGKPWNRCQEKATGSESFTVTLLLFFPSDIVHLRKLHERCTQHRTVFIFTACVSLKTKPRNCSEWTGEGRERVGWREGKLRTFTWDQKPTHGYFDTWGPHQRSGKDSRYTVTSSPMHWEESAFFFWQMTMYLVGQARFHSSVLSKFDELKWISCSPNVYFRASSLTSPYHVSSSYWKQFIHIYFFNWDILSSDIWVDICIYCEKILYF